MSERTGVLLINVGTPEAPTGAAVRRYLRQFLMDPRVVDLAGWKRWPLVHLLIAPFRARSSARAYAKVWSDRGSPLLAHSLDLVAKVQARLDTRAHVTLGMRYGRPSIGSALAELRDAGCRRIVVMPLYAQYTASATGTAVAEAFNESAKLWDVPSLNVVPPFHNHPSYLEARTALARPLVDEARAECVFFSFHGIPVRHLLASDPSGRCLQNERCCERLGASNAHCYRAQCFATARAVGERLEIPEASRVVCFQSRLGRSPWISPHTDRVLVEAAERGARRAVIISSFVTDCLETLEELGIRAVESWHQAGGEELIVVPSPNAVDPWADAVVEILRSTEPQLRK